MTWPPNTWGFASHVSILRLSHTWKSCQPLLRLSCKVKVTNFCINPIHGDFNYVVFVVTSLSSFTYPPPNPLYIISK